MPVGALTDGVYPDAAAVYSEWVGASFVTLVLGPMLSPMLGEMVLDSPLG
jgi:hypothetical protein